MEKYEATKIVKEIFTIYQQPTNNIKEMENLGVTWWKDWDIGDGTIGQRYGATVKRYDLINNLIKDIQNDPYGRRKVVSLWQETDLHECDQISQDPYYYQPPHHNH